MASWLCVRNISKRIEWYRTKPRRHEEETGVRWGINTKHTKFGTDKDTKYLGDVLCAFSVQNFVTFVFNLFGSALCLLRLSHVLANPEEILHGYTG